MNVLFLSTNFPTRREPNLATYIHEYARSLALKHNVTIVYPQQLGAPGVGDEPFSEEVLVEPRIRLVNYTYSHLPKTWMLSYLAAYRKVWRRIRSEWKIDVIYAHIVIPAGVAAVLLGKAFRIPVILTEHWGPVGQWFKVPSQPPSLLHATLKYTYRQADYLTAVSDSLAAEIDEAFGAPAHGKLDYPVDCSLFYPETPPPQDVPPRVLCVTRAHSWDWRKGVPDLLAAWKLVSERTSGKVYLDIVGEQVENLAPQVEALGISETCILHRWRPASELAPLMRRSALLVIPSLYETFGRSGMEALASGVPVVATQCGGPNEYVKEGTGLLVPSGNPRALAEGVLAGLERDRFLPPEELARRTRERFSYKTICERFTDVATALINDRRAQQSCS